MAAGSDRTEIEMAGVGYFDTAEAEPAALAAAGAVDQNLQAELVRSASAAAEQIVEVVALAVLEQRLVAEP